MGFVIMGIAKLKFHQSRCTGPMALFLHIQLKNNCKYGTNDTNKLISGYTLNCFFFFQSVLFVRFHNCMEFNYTYRQWFINKLNGNFVKEGSCFGTFPLDRLGQGVVEQKQKTQETSTEDDICMHMIKASSIFRLPKVLCFV